MAVTKEDVKEYIKNASVLEVAELVKELEDEFGVSAQAPMAVAAVAAPGAGGAAAAEAEKTEFDVVLTDVGDKKIQVVKEVKNITGKDLKESKAMVDKVPSVIVEKAAKDRAEEVKKKLEAAGATVELK